MSLNREEEFSNNSFQMDYEYIRKTLYVKLSAVLTYKDKIKIAYSHERTD